MFLQPPRAMKTRTTCFRIVLVAFAMMMSGFCVWRPTTTSSRGGFFLLGAEAAELEIGWDGLVYTVDDDSTIQETRDFDGVTKTIGPYYLSERAQHIKDEFIVPYDWPDYLQDFQSYMDEFCEVEGGDDWNKFKDYEFTPSTGGTRVASNTFMTKYLTETINDNSADDASKRLKRPSRTCAEFTPFCAICTWATLRLTMIPTGIELRRCITAKINLDRFIIAKYLGGQFDTMDGNSATNVKINLAFRQGKQSSSITTKEQQYEIIEHQMRIVYAQGIIKYALQMDRAVC